MSVFVWDATKENIFTHTSFLVSLLIHTFIFFISVAHTFGRVLISSIVCTKRSEGADKSDSDWSSFHHRLSTQETERFKKALLSRDLRFYSSFRSFSCGRGRQKRTKSYTFTNENAIAWMRPETVWNRVRVRQLKTTCGFYSPLLKDVLDCGKWAFENSPLGEGILNHLENFESKKVHKYATHGSFTIHVIICLHFSVSLVSFFFFTSFTFVSN